jgi:hypothetical protein
MEHIWTSYPPDAAKRAARIQRYYRDVSMYPLHMASRPLFLAPRLAALHFRVTQDVMPAGPG